MGACSSSSAQAAAPAAMTQTPTITIGICGPRNAGKTALINAFTDNSEAHIVEINKVKTIITLVELPDYSSIDHLMLDAVVCVLDASLFHALASPEPVRSQSIDIDMDAGDVGAAGLDAAGMALIVPKDLSQAAAEVLAEAASTRAGATEAAVATPTSQSARTATEDLPATDTNKHDEAHDKDQAAAEAEAEAETELKAEPEPEAEPEAADAAVAATAAATPAAGAAAAGVGAGAGTGAVPSGATTGNDTNLTQQQQQREHDIFGDMHKRLEWLFGAPQLEYGDNRTWSNISLDMGVDAEFNNSSMLGQPAHAPSPSARANRLLRSRSSIDGALITRGLSRGMSSVLNRAASNTGDARLVSRHSSLQVDTSMGDAPRSRPRNPGIPFAVAINKVDAVPAGSMQALRALSRQCGHQNRCAVFVVSCKPGEEDKRSINSLFADMIRQHAHRQQRLKEEEAAALQQSPSE